jgi:hypothetical protein
MVLMNNKEISKRDTLKKINWYVDQLENCRKNERNLIENIESELGSLFDSNTIQEIDTLNELIKMTIEQEQRINEQNIEQLDRLQ